MLPISTERQKALIVARLAKTLEDWGVDGDPKEFTDQLVQVWQAMYLAFSFDELLLRPREALKLCDAARTATKYFDLPDDVILRAIMNRRKQP